MRKDQTRWAGTGASGGGTAQSRQAATHQHEALEERSGACATLQAIETLTTRPAHGALALRVGFLILDQLMQAVHFENLCERVQAARCRKRLGLPCLPNRYRFARDCSRPPGSYGQVFLRPSGSSRHMRLGLADGGTEDNAGNHHAGNNHEGVRGRSRDCTEQCRQEQPREVGQPALHASQ